MTIACFLYLFHRPGFRGSNQILDFTHHLAATESPAFLPVEFHKPLDLAQGVTVVLEEEDRI